MKRCWFLEEENKPILYDYFITKANNEKIIFGLKRMTDADGEF